MNNRNKSIIAKDWILKLANGINPLDGSIIPDGDIVNNVHISRCLFYVSELLGTLPQKGNKKSIHTAWKPYLQQLFAYLNFAEQAMQEFSCLSFVGT